MSSEPTLASTTQLVERARSGEASARDALYRRYLPLLTQWARGRLPRYGRDIVETDDLVQVTLLRSLKRLDDFESQRPGAFLAYLRTILMNNVRDEMRARARRPQRSSILESLPATQPSSVEQEVGRETLEAYERALTKLPEEKRHAVLMRVEFEMSYDDIAAELEKPSANAARMTVSRALADLADLMES